MTGEPYTHSMHAQACQDAARSRQVLSTWVQVKTCGTAHCARILDAWTSSDGQDFWTLEVVQPLAYRGSYPVKAVRQCSGVDGRCTCGDQTA